MLWPLMAHGRRLPTGLGPIRDSCRLRGGMQPSEIIAEYTAPFLRFQEVALSLEDQHRLLIADLSLARRHVRPPHEPVGPTSSVRVRTTWWSSGLCGGNSASGFIRCSISSMCQLGSLRSVRISLRNAEAVLLHPRAYRRAGPRCGYARRIVDDVVQAVCKHGWNVGIPLRPTRKLADLVQVYINKRPLPGAGVPVYGDAQLAHEVPQRVKTRVVYVGP